MADWSSPLDWVTGQRLRARNLNSELNGNIGWLKDRPLSIVNVPVQTANLQMANTEWSVLGADHQLELVLPDVCNVLLCASFYFTASSVHQIWIDWVRDGDYWLSSSNGAKPATAGDGLSEVLGSSVTDESVLTMWWDEEVAPGRHTWDLAMINASGNLNIQQTDMAWQLWALAW